MKDQLSILKKLGIEELNQMQKESSDAILSDQDVVLLSPTGTGKTLAFLLPLIQLLDRDKKATQALILVPSRELAMQIEQVAREMGSGFKINAVYGGRAGYKDRNDLSHPPTILIGTPGRVGDHIRSEVLDTSQIDFLILDEFDKSLETGFEKEMKGIIESIGNLKKRILTSATDTVIIPDFVKIQNPITLDFVEEPNHRLFVQTIISREKDKLKALIKLLAHIGEANGIIFCNYKEDIQLVSHHLKTNSVQHACFYGGMEQVDRETSLIQFRNGSHRILLATDLAARGLDIPEMDYIIHYQLPPREPEFIHRNGRTARMNQKGIAYLLKWKDKDLPSYITEIKEFPLREKNPVGKTKWVSLLVSGGRKDKISKGDIAGLFFKQGGLEKDELGKIEIKQDCCFVAVPRTKAKSLIKLLDKSKLKTKKVKISAII